MSKEKQTDNNSWQHRLQHLDDVQDADAALNKAHAWERLHTRLHKKEDRKIAMWYWAAACLLLLLALPVYKMFMQKRLAKDLVIQKELVAPHPSVVATDKNEPAVIVSAPVIKKMPPSQYSTHSTDVKMNRRAVAKTAVVIAEKPLPDTTQKETATIITDTTVSVAKTVVVPAKKRLPVVHINELDKHDRENERLATHAQWPVFQARFLNQDINYTTLPAANAKQDVLQIKIPLKN